MDSYRWQSCTKAPISYIHCNNTSGINVRLKQNTGTNWCLEFKKSLQRIYMAHGTLNKIVEISQAQSLAMQ